MLTGSAKKDYQREYMRKRQGVKNPRVGLITSDGSNNNGSNNVKTPDLKSKLAKVGLNLEGNRVSGAVGLGSSPLKTSLNSRVPLYNRRIHKQGDTVRMPSGEIVVVPELDGEGNVLEAF